MNTPQAQAFIASQTFVCASAGNHGIGVASGARDAGAKARIHLAELLLRDYGSPLDYEDAYRWLYNSVTADQRKHKRIAMLRSGLEQRMPQNIIARAKRRDTFWWMYS